MTRLLWKIKLIYTKLWFRASIFGVLAVVTALLAYYFKDSIPESMSQKIGADAVDGLLNIIASTMLAVTIFSLSSMVSAYSAATTNVTPRSTRLLLDDKTSQTVLSTFLGAFIFSLVGIIALKIGIYGSGGRLILFVVTIMVIVVIIMTLIRWIEYLSRLGRVGETINRVEKATTEATVQRLKQPYLGGVRLEKGSPLPPAAKPVVASEIGYVQFIDMPSLSAIAKEADGQIYVSSLPGAFNTPNKPVAFAVGIDVEELGKKIADCFIIGDDRSFEQDPRFGMIVLSEIASRALSPAINDPGTAIDIIGTSVRILSLWAAESDSHAIEPDYPSIFVPPLQTQDIFDDVFLPIARDGAGMREIGVRLQKAFIALAAMGDEAFAQAARNCSQDAFMRAKKGLSHDADIQSVAQLRRHLEGEIS